MTGGRKDGSRGKPLRTAGFRARAVLGRFTLASHGAMLAVRAISKVFVSAFLYKTTGDISSLLEFFACYYLVTPLVFLVTARHLRPARVVWLLRAGLTLFVAFYVVLGLMKTDAAQHVRWFGVAYGIACGLYWLPYNVFRAESRAGRAVATFFTREKLIEVFVGATFPPLSGYLIWSTGSYPLAFLAMGFLLAVGLLLTRSMGSYPVTAIPGETLRASVGHIWQDRNARLAMWASLAAGIGFLGITETLHVVVVLGLSESELVLGFVFAGVPVLGFGAVFVAGRLSPDRYRLVTNVCASGIVLGMAQVALVRSAHAFAVYLGVWAILASVLNVQYHHSSFRPADSLKADGGSVLDFIVMREVFLNAGRFLSVVTVLAGTRLSGGASATLEPVWIGLGVAAAGAGAVALALGRMRDVGDPVRRSGSRIPAGVAAGPRGES